MFSRLWVKIFRASLKSMAISIIFYAPFHLVRTSVCGFMNLILVVSQQLCNFRQNCSEVFKTLKDFLIFKTDLFSYYLEEDPWGNCQSRHLLFLKWSQYLKPPCFNILAPLELPNLKCEKNNENFDFLCQNVSVLSEINVPGG